MSRRNYFDEMVQQGKELRAAFQKMLYVLAHVDSCSDCSVKWDEIRKHASEEIYD
ncbi:hypothetical protein KAR91_44275 [Candidatus Pacearchaeota archaeon]|nr:hypothetical protein [Candidatus Pacearchaeota archaeon]